MACNRERRPHTNEDTGAFFHQGEPIDRAVFRQGGVVLDEMDTALLREHCFEAEERSHDYHTSCERRAAGKGTHHVCGPAPGELVDHFCHRAIDLYHDPLARVGTGLALPLACAPVFGCLDRLSRHADVWGAPPLLTPTYN